MASNKCSRCSPEGCSSTGLHAIHLVARVFAPHAGASEVALCLYILYKNLLTIYARHICPNNDELATLAVQAVDTEGVQAALQSVLNEAAARLLRSKSKDLAMLQSPLSMLSGVSWLPLANHIFTGWSSRCLMIQHDSAVPICMSSSSGVFCASNRKHHARLVSPLVYGIALFVAVNAVLSTLCCPSCCLASRSFVTADCSDDIHCAVQLCIALPAS